MTFKLELTVTGQEELKKELVKWAKRYPPATAAALYRAGVRIERQAVQRTPVEYGVLRNSRYVAPPADEQNPRVEVGYGTDYAVAVHERTELAHPRGGEAKYLQRAVDAEMGDMLQKLGSDVRAFAASGTRLGAPLAPTQPVVAESPRKKLGDRLRRVKARRKGQR